MRISDWSSDVCSSDLYDYGSYRDDGVTYSNEDGRNEYQGTWTGTWTGEDGRTYSGTYTGAFNGDVYGEDVPPHWDDMPPPPEAMPLRPYPGGYYSQGYYYPDRKSTRLNSSH